MLPAATPLRKIPCGISVGRLVGGLDLAATLAANRPIAERGLLAEADGGVVAIAMAERLSPETAASITTTLDTGAVIIERDGLTLSTPSRFGIVLLDEGIAEDERPPASMTERIAFELDLTGVARVDLTLPDSSAEQIAAARDRLGAVRTDADTIKALCETAVMLGVGSVRAELLAVAVARAAAALAGRDAVNEADACLAARFVFAHRATQMPAPPEAAAESTSEDTSQPPPPSADPSDSESDADTPPRDLADILRESVTVALPADLLARVAMAQRQGRATSQTRAGNPMAGGKRGRVIGIRTGRPSATARINLLATLRAAAPWQKLRGAEGQATGRIRVMVDDLRVSRFKANNRTAIIFAVDASGSQALNRLAEAKGAIELLLGRAYVRRDEVALIAFRGAQADLVLPPTQSLTRAKRLCAGLPGGGGTPLAAGIDAAVTLGLQIRRSGETPLVVFLTDGQANIARNGDAGRARAEADALSAARTLRAAGLGAILIDTAPRPARRARDIAEAMGATYLPMPQANATAMTALLHEATG
jgi:magnesium chelatase subunit D